MSVARSYASALYEAAREAKAGPQELERIEAQLDSFVGVLRASKDARVALLSPATAAKDKAAVVTEISKKVGATGLLANFLVLMARKERLGLIDEVREAFGEVRLQSEGGIQGKVVSAEPLEAGDLRGLAEAFGKKFGKRVEFRASTDPNLLAGMKVTVNGVTYDGTLRSQLTRLRDRLVYGTGMTQ
jgi:ATP synthase F1 delta subunit